MTPKTLTRDEERALRLLAFGEPFWRQLDTWNDMRYIKPPSAVRDLRMRLALMLGLDAGLRVLEIAHFTPSMLNVSSTGCAVLTIPGTLSHASLGRRIPATDQLRDAITAYLKGCAARYPDWRIPFVLSAPTHAVAPDTSTIRRWVYELTKLALNVEYHPHALRHTFATRLMAVSDIRTVQELLGHISVTSTQIYTHVSSDDLRNAIRARAAASSVT